MNRAEYESKSNTSIADSGIYQSRDMQNVNNQNCFACEERRCYMRIPSVRFKRKVYPFNTSDQMNHVTCYSQ